MKKEGGKDLCCATEGDSNQFEARRVPRLWNYTINAPWPCHNCRCISECIHQGSLCSHPESSNRWPPVLSSDTICSVCRSGAWQTVEFNERQGDSAVCSPLIMNLFTKIESCVLFLSFIHWDDSLLTSLRAAAPLHWWPSRDAPKTSTMRYRVCTLMETQTTAPHPYSNINCCSVQMQLRAALIVVLSNYSEKERQMNIGQTEWWMDRWMDGWNLFFCVFLSVSWHI